ncbi:LuxR family transcriptional regulator [Sphingobium yanoikuyae]|uniref:LuxR family transcriptional regulator n=1 Tax=Sphingobium yanoikuyae TaxID=13690 RepID=UPI003B8F356B
MYVDAKLRETLSRFSMATSIEALRDGLADAALPMGFPYVALVQHGGLPRLVERSMVVTNYPAVFVQFYIDNHCFIIDPVYEVSQLLDRPFGWDEIGNFVELTEHQRALFEEARDYGIVHGITVPLHLPNVSYASCTFARPEPIEITPSLMTTLQIIAGFAFKAGLYLHHAMHDRNVLRLTRREAECTALIALGKTDWEIGQILGIAQTTVRYFITRAKQRYGVFRRSELVARAIVDSQVIRNRQDKDIKGPEGDNDKPESE